MAKLDVVNAEGHAMGTDNLLIGLLAIWEK